MTYSRKGMLEATALCLACCQTLSGTRATCTAWVSSLSVRFGSGVSALSAIVFCVSVRRMQVDRC